MVFVEGVVDDRWTLDLLSHLLFQFLFVQIHILAIFRNFGLLSQKRRGIRLVQLAGHFTLLDRLLIARFSRIHLRLLDYSLLR